ncbi:hypothetical protein IAT38_008245 [Cryptococcus sp. DSM 104549]
MSARRQDENAILSRRVAGSLRPVKKYSAANENAIGAKPRLGGKAAVPGSASSGSTGIKKPVVAGPSKGSDQEKAEKPGNKSIATRRPFISLSNTPSRPVLSSKPTGSTIQSAHPIPPPSTQKKTKTVLKPRTAGPTPSARARIPSSVRAKRAPEVYGYTPASKARTVKRMEDNRLEYMPPPATERPHLPLGVDQPIKNSDNDLFAPQQEPDLDVGLDLELPTEQRPALKDLDFDLNLDLDDVRAEIHGLDLSEPGLDGGFFADSLP